MSRGPGRLFGARVATTASGSASGLPYMASLDGIRAVSILAIMANHSGLPWAQGGLLSVNAFFVLSGFLITQLLLKEWRRSGRIRLRAFWSRRARRLLPALFVLLGVIGVFVALYGAPGSQPLLFGDGLSTLLYVNNWHQILDHQSYFAQVSAPSPLLHTWTLGIEEQFYLVWPVVVVVVLKLWRSTTVLLAVAVAGVLASATEMALLFHPHADPTRLYFGTDTRAQDVLVGAALGIVLSTRRPAETRRGQAAWSAAAVAAAAVFVWDWMRTGPGASFPYRGGFLLADVTVAVVICGVTLAPRQLPARILSFAPLRFVGCISYGLYLWHWPIDLVVNHARTGLQGYGLFALRSVIALVVATASWRLVEIPVRRLDFSSWRTWTWIPAGAATVAGLLVVMSAVTTGGGPSTVPLTPMVATASASSPASPLAADPAPATAAGGSDQSASAGRGAVGHAAAVIPSSVAQRQAYYAESFPDDPGLEKVLFVGDSLSLYVGYGLAPLAAHYGITIGGRSTSGCGLATVEPFNLHGTPTYSLAPCSSWPTGWQDDVDQLHPDVVALVLGWWDCMDRMYEGRWQHLGDPDFDAYETANFQKAVSILSSQGAKVALMTAPYFDTGEQLDGQPWDEDDPARVNVLNGIIKQVGADHPGVVSVIPLNKYLDPDGHFTWTIDGQVMRLGDGVHTTPAAGPYLAPLILPRLEALGHEGTLDQAPEPRPTAPEVEPNVVGPVAVRITLAVAREVSAARL